MSILLLIIPLSTKWLGDDTKLCTKSRVLWVWKMLYENIYELMSRRKVLNKKFFVQNQEHGQVDELLRTYWDYLKVFLLAFIVVKVSFRLLSYTSLVKKSTNLIEFTITRIFPFNSMLILSALGRLIILGWKFLITFPT